MAQKRRVNENKTGIIGQGFSFFFLMSNTMTDSIECSTLNTNRVIHSVRELSFMDALLKKMHEW